MDIVKNYDLFLNSSKYCILITESQNVRGWKGPLWVI